MDTGKLHSIITKKNERLEQDALYQAENIIEQIARHQQQIAEQEARIAELRKELVALQVTQIDPTTILGGE